MTKKVSSLTGCPSDKDQMDTPKSPQDFIYSAFSHVKIMRRQHHFDDDAHERRSAPRDEHSICVRTKQPKDLTPSKARPQNNAEEPSGSDDALKLSPTTAENTALNVTCAPVSCYRSFVRMFTCIRVDTDLAVAYVILFMTVCASVFLAFAS